MNSRRLQAILCAMDRAAATKRYVLVPRTGDAGPAPGAPKIKRYSLARIGPSPRSALGQDRHERLERAASVRRA
jgi:hypothetical protein